MDCRFYVEGKRIRRDICHNASEFAPLKTIIIDGVKYMMLSVEIKYNAGVVTTVHLMEVSNLERQDIYDFAI